MKKREPHASNDRTLAPRVKFTPEQETYVSDLIERRLGKQRRRLEADHEANLAVVRGACQRTMSGMHEAIVRLTTERNALINEKWALLEQIAELSYIRRVVGWFRR